MNQAITLLTQANSSLTDAHYQQLLTYAAEDVDRFWSEVASLITWHTPFSAVRTGAGSEQRWFVDGEINYYAQLFQPDRATAEAVVVLKRDGARVSYTIADLQQKVDIIAQQLHQAGLTPGSTLLMSTPRREVQLLLALACLAIGARFNATFFKVPNAGLVAQQAVMGAQLVVIDELVREEGIPTFSAATVVTVAQVLQWLQDTPPVPPGTGYVYNANDPTFYLASSGTTGTPKAIATGNAGMLMGALVTYYLSTYVADESREYLGLDLAWGPAFIMGVYSPLLLQKTLVLTEEYLDFTQPQLLERLNAERVSASTLPISLFDAPVQPTKKLALQRLFLTGMALSAQTAGSISHFIETADLTTTYGYGSSELAGLALLSFVAGDPAPLAATSLRPYPGVQPQLGEHDRLLLSNTIPSVCVAIKDNQPLYEALWTAEGLLSTNDRVALVGPEQYQLRGRLDAVVKIKGREVDTGVLQSAIAGHTERAVAVLAENDTLYCVVAGEADPALQQTISTFVHEQFGSYAVPQIVAVPTLPLTAAGKLDVSLLRKELSQYGTVDRA